MMLTRRDMLLRSSAVFAASLCAVPAFAEEQTSLPILDTHQHLWDLDKFRLPWLDRAGPLLKRNYLTDDYLKAIEGTGITRAIYMEVEVVPEQFDAEADWVIDLCRQGKSPTIAAVIGGRLQSDDFKNYITRFKGDPIIKGIRNPFPADAASNNTFIANINLLRDVGLSYDLLPDPSQLPQVVKLVDQAKTTRFILDHCGNASTRFYKDETLKDKRRIWEDGISALAQRPNVICKISGVAEAADPADATPDLIAPVVNRCLDAFGPDRVIFASNWPVCLKSLTIAQWLTIAKQITASRGQQFQRKLFHDNAASFYGLEQA
jgi:predicted TIM-barrel fold metal-dependent hydrolase